MLNRLITLVTIVLLTSSCSIYHVTSNQTAEEFYPTKDVEKVVFIEIVEQPHKTIGNVIVNAERRQRLSEVIHRMKREAAILGGDAITDIKTDASGIWKRLPVQQMIGNAYVRANFTASVIIFE